MDCVMLRVKEKNWQKEIGHFLELTITNKGRLH